MKIKITIVLFLLVNNTAHSMNLFKAITGLFDRNIAEIKSDISCTKTNLILDPETRATRLTELYEEILNVYSHSTDKESNNPDIIKHYTQELDRHQKEIQDLKNRSLKAQDIEQAMAQQHKMKNLTLPEAHDYYKQLVQLCPHKIEYHEKLIKIETAKRQRIKDRIGKLQESDNKKELLLAYQDLLATYKTDDEDRLPYLKVITALKRQVAEEEAQQNQLDQCNAITQKIHNISCAPTKSSELDCKMKLIELHTQRLKLATESNNATTQVIEDRKKITQLRYEALALAQQQNNSQKQAELLKLITQD